MEIRTNISAMNAHLRMKQSASNQWQAAERLTSGHRINSAADDPAGLAISESLRAQIIGTEQAIRNTDDGIALIQTAEGGLQNVCDMIHRLRELIVQAANDTNSLEGRHHIQGEIDNILDEIDTLASRVEFNGRKILSGDYGGRDTPNSNPLFFQVGANSDHGFRLNIERLDTEGLGLRNPTISVVEFQRLNPDGTPALDINNNPIYDPATSGVYIHMLLDRIDEALEVSLTERSHLGAAQSRLEHARQSLSTTSLNLSDAESRVRNADMAREMMDYMQMNVLFSAASSMLAQAKQSPNMVLQLLQG